MTQIEGSCFTPIGCLARIESNIFFITGYSASLDGSHNLIKTVQGNINDSEKLALDLAETMIQNGAREFMYK